MAKIKVPVAGTIGKSVRTSPPAPPAVAQITQAQFQSIVNAVLASIKQTSPSGLQPTDWSLITAIPTNVKDVAALSANGQPIRNPDGSWSIVPLSAGIGPSGDDGAPGDIGPPGKAGADGPQGPVGPTGPSGGPAGPAGPAILMQADDGESNYMVPGPTGMQGPAGPAGVSGSAGMHFLLDDAPQGDTGPPGQQGVAGSGTVTPAVPGTIADLVFWWESDDIVASSGKVISKLRDRTPWISGVGAAPATGVSGVTCSATPINSLTALAWPSASSGRMTLQNGGTPVLDKSTVFVVVRPASTGVSQVVLGAPTGGLEFDLSSGNTFGITKAFVAAIGNSTATFAAGTTYQVNATYDSSTGAWAFRVARAASGSGTNVQAITAVTTGIGYNVAAASQDLNASLAVVMVYNRVLTAPEIASVEAYLLAKWGV